jgi:hypothetical protein
MEGVQLNQKLAHGLHIGSLGMNTKLPDGTFIWKQHILVDYM